MQHALGKMLITLTLFVQFLRQGATQTGRCGCPGGVKASTLVQNATDVGSILTLGAIGPISTTTMKLGP